MRGRRLLLVEDDADAAEALSGLLSHLGAEVRHAAHGLAALAEMEAASSDRPMFDAVIIDLDLPGLSGEQLAAMIRPRWPQSSLLALSASGAEDFAERCAQAGFARWARKPVDGVALLELLAVAPPPRRQARNDRVRWLAGGFSGDVPG